MIIQLQYAYVQHFSIVISDTADGSDYTYTYTTGIIDDSNSSICNIVPIISDIIDEDVEYFIAKLSTTSTFAGLTLNPEAAIVRIIDDDRELHSCVNYTITILHSVSSHTYNHWTGADGLLSV